MPFDRSPTARIVGLADARRFFAACFAQADLKRETLWAVHLDSRGGVLHASRHDGDEQETEIPIRAIVADALRANSAGLLLAHNHPSGDGRPSASDCRATRRLVVVAKALDCAVVDHLILAGGAWTSFRKLGLL